MKEANSNSFQPKGVKLTGINQMAYLDPEYVGLDWIRGLTPLTASVVHRPAGITRLMPINDDQRNTLGQQRVLAIHQTFNSNDLILIQTDSAIYSVTLDELMNRASTPSLVGLPEDYEETMAYAVIVHKEANGVDGGSISANTWTQAPLNNIAIQINPDGTSASFATLASNRITLPAGTYRFRGWTMGSTSTGSSQDFKARLWNVTSGSALFSGSTNDIIRSATFDAAQNAVAYLMGAVVLSVTTEIEIRHYSSATGTTYGFGRARSTGASSGEEVYRSLEIVKTA